MQGQSYQVKTVLEQCDARKKAFLAFKESPINPLARSPRINDTKVCMILGLSNWTIWSLLHLFLTIKFPLH